MELNLLSGSFLVTVVAVALVKVVAVDGRLGIGLTYFVHFIDVAPGYETLFHF